jgi:hypothetical protein
MLSLATKFFFDNQKILTNLNEEISLSILRKMFRNDLGDNDCDEDFLADIVTLQLNVMGLFKGKYIFADNRKYLGYDYSFIGVDNGKAVLKNAKTNEVFTIDFYLLATTNLRNIICFLSCKDNIVWYDNENK